MPIEPRVHPICNRAGATQVTNAEGRLGGVLARYMQGREPSADEVVAAAGATPQQFFAFWLVTIAAMAAWDVRLSNPSTEAEANAKLQQLMQVRDTVEGAVELASESGITLLAPLIAASRLFDAPGTYLRPDYTDEVRTVMSRPRRPWPALQLGPEPPTPQRKGARGMEVALAAERRLGSPLGARRPSPLPSA